MHVDIVDLRSIGLHLDITRTQSHVGIYGSAHTYLDSEPYRPIWLWVRYWFCNIMQMMLRSLYVGLIIQIPAVAQVCVDRWQVPINVEGGGWQAKLWKNSFHVLCDYSVLQRTSSQMRSPSLTPKTACARTVRWFFGVGLEYGGRRDGHFHLVLWPIFGPSSHPRIMRSSLLILCGRISPMVTSQKVCENNVIQLVVVVDLEPIAYQNHRCDTILKLVSTFATAVKLYYHHLPQSILYSACNATPLQGVSVELVTTLLMEYCS